MSSTIAATEGTVFAVVQFDSSLGFGEPDRILKELGVEVVQNPDLLSQDRLIRVGPDGLQALLQVPEVRAIYPASMEMIAGVPLQSCPGEIADPDSEADALFQAVGGWYGILTDGALNWNLSKPTKQWSPDRTRAVIEKALAEWSRPVQLSFRYSPMSSVRTIAVEFHTGEHGDVYPFDGRGGFLAHAFYPPPWNVEPIAGDVHLDDDETWTEGGTPDLYSVVLHEVGHALGLQHSAIPGSVMYPYYRQLDKLQDSDIRDLSRFFPPRTMTASPETPALFSITVNAPAPGTASAVDVSGNVAGATGTVEINWQSGWSGGKVTATGGNWTVKSIPLNPGNNQVVFTAKDSAGRQASRPVTLVRVAAALKDDKVAPVLTIRTPSGTVYGTSAASVRISGTATDNTGVKEVTWQCGSASGVASGTTTWSFDLPLKLGDNQVIVRAKDEAGNAGWRSLLITRR